MNCRNNGVVRHRKWGVGSSVPAISLCCANLHGSWLTLPHILPLGIGAPSCVFCPGQLTLGHISRHKSPVKLHFSEVHHFLTFRTSTSYYDAFLSIILPCFIASSSQWDIKGKVFNYYVPQFAMYCGLVVFAEKFSFHRQRYPHPQYAFL